MASGSSMPHKASTTSVSSTDSIGSVKVYEAPREPLRPTENVITQNRVVRTENSIQKVMHFMEETFPQNNFDGNNITIHTNSTQARCYVNQVKKNWGKTKYLPFLQRKIILTHAC